MPSAHGPPRFLSNTGSTVSDCFIAHDPIFFIVDIKSDQPYDFYRNVILRTCRALTIVGLRHPCFSSDLSWRTRSDFKWQANCRMDSSDFYRTKIDAHDPVFITILVYDKKSVRVRLAYG